MSDNNDRQLSMASNKPLYPTPVPRFSVFSLIPFVRRQALLVCLLLYVRSGPYDHVLELYFCPKKGRGFSVGEHGMHRVRGRAKRE